MQATNRDFAVPGRLLAMLLVGAAVAIALGVYGNEHDPARSDLPELFFSGTINLKVWFASTAILLVLWQVYLGLVMYGALPYAGGTPAWIGLVHRISGFAAFAFTLPVAYHCLYSLGFQDYDNGDVPVIGTDRVFAHSIFGCIWYGAFVTKVLLVTWKGAPGWSLPVGGGLLFGALTGVWYTSAYWFFNDFGFPEF